MTLDELIEQKVQELQALEGSDIKVYSYDDWEKTKAFLRTSLRTIAEETIKAVRPEDATECPDHARSDEWHICGFCHSHIEKQAVINEFDRRATAFLSPSDKNE